jgi:hypothetical protein
MELSIPDKIPSKRVTYDTRLHGLCEDEDGHLVIREFPEEAEDEFEDVEEMGIASLTFRKGMPCR